PAAVPGAVGAVNPPAHPVTAASAATPYLEVDVELVDPASLAPPTSGEDRPLTMMSRRDWIMLIAGAASVVASLTLGFSIARLVRPRPVPPPSAE
ncbi:MAG: hypothetical protein NZ703_09060, partial [Gemmataceae bacterium]|nr:hypothetical protein [Gemmataceae bacterium]